MNIIPLTSDGEGRRTVTLNDAIVTIVTRYNYRARCWAMDILDTEATALATGIMLVPDVDLLKAYVSLRAQLGLLQIYEKAVGDYMDPDKLGTDVVLTWIP